MGYGNDAFGFVHRDLNLNNLVFGDGAVGAIDFDLCGLGHYLLAALAVWQYCEESARRIFGDRTGDLLADELLEALRDAGDQGMTRSEIYDHFGHNQRRGRLGAVLRDLRTQGRARIEKDKQDGPGRPTERWFIADDEMGPINAC